MWPRDPGSGSTRWRKRSPSPKTHTARCPRCCVRPLRSRMTRRSLTPTPSNRASPLRRDSERRVARMPATLRLDKDVETAIQTRLRRIEGQVAGLQRMLETGRDCAEIAQQVAAARAALDRVAIDLVAAGLERCLRMELNGQPQAAATLNKLKKTFLMLK